MRRERSEVRGQGSGFRVQRSEVRGQGSGFIVRGAAALSVMLLAGCATPPAPQVTDEDWVSHVTTGRGLYARGDYRRGASAFERAQVRARAMDDANALAVAAVNRAQCLLAEDQPGEARTAIEEALADPRVSRERRMELLAAGARADWGVGDAPAALARLAELQAMTPPALLRAQAALLHSEIQLAQGDAAAAAKALADGPKPNEWQRVPASLRAARAGQQASIAAVGGDPAAAVTHWDEAARLWQQADRLPEMARALAAGAQQAQAAGDAAGAGERLYRAARSLWAQGVQPEAVARLQEGLAIAEQMPDSPLAKKLAALYVTFQAEQRLNK